MSALVHMEAAGGVEKHHVVAVIPGVADGLLGDMDGIALPHLKDRECPADRRRPAAASMAAGRYTSQATSSGRLPNWRRMSPASLAVVVVLPAPCRPTIITTVGPLEAMASLRAGAAHELCQLLVDDLDDLLGGGEAVQHVRAAQPAR